MEQLKFTGKRLAYLVVMLFGVATLVFILTKMIPGDPTVANLSQRALNDPEVVAAYKAKYGLDQPIFVQYVLYIKNLLKFDLGTSIRTNKPVLAELARCYPATIELALFAILLAAVFGILFGVISAIRRNSILDQAVRAVSVTGVSIPNFWFALLVLYFFYYKLHIFPGPGRLSNSFSAPATVTGLYVLDSLLEGNIPKAMDALSHLILPGTVLAAFTMGLITRTTRSNLLDVMSMDYIRTARAKGIGRVGLIVRHALGNALIPVLTVIGLGLGNLLGGMVLVDPLQFEMSIAAADLSGYVPAFGWEMGPPTEKQRSALEKFGIFPDEIDSAGKASALLDRLSKRRTEGLSTPRQIRVLENFGFRNVGTWPFQDAKHMIDRMAAGGRGGRWRVPSGVDPATYVPVGM